MDPVTIYYCIKSASTLGQVALAYKKCQNAQDAVKRLSCIQEKFDSLKTDIDSIHLFVNLIRNDIHSLMHMYFRSAYENLNYATNASEECFYNYIAQAKNRFIDALTVEQNENLILSYVGLAFCQSILGDKKNSYITLNRIKGVSFNNIDIDFDKAIPNCFEFAQLLAYCYINGIPVMEQLSKEELRGEKLIEKYEQDILYQTELNDTKEKLSSIGFWKDLLKEIKKNGGMSEYYMNSLMNGDAGPLEKKFKLALNNIRLNAFEDFKSDIIGAFNEL